MIVPLILSKLVDTEPVTNKSRPLTIVIKVTQIETEPITNESMPLTQVDELTLIETKPITN